MGDDESRRFPGVCVHKEAPVGEFIDKPGRLTVTARKNLFLELPARTFKIPVAKVDHVDTVFRWNRFSA